MDRTIVKNLTFFFGNNPVPKIISINHSDGSTQTQTIPLFDSHQRYLNFGAVGRNPAGLLPMVLEQDKESRHLIDIAHTSSLEAAISEYTTNGTFVRCLGLLSCQFCKKNMQPEVKQFPAHGEVMGHPAIETKFIYVRDMSAHTKRSVMQEKLLPFLQSGPLHTLVHGIFKPRRITITKLTTQ